MVTFFFVSIVYSESPFPIHFYSIVKYMPRSAQTGDKHASIRPSFHTPILELDSRCGSWAEDADHSGAF